MQKKHLSRHWIRLAGSLLIRKLWHQSWKRVKDVGRRWIAEIGFSSIKTVLGEGLFSKKFSAQKVEVGLKIMLYNRFISL